MSLYGTLKDITDKLVVDDHIRIDHFVFKLHYIWTVTLLLAFSVLLSLSQYAGDPIDCIVNHGIQGSETFDKYCWVEGTYTKREPVDDPRKFKSEDPFVKEDLRSLQCFDHKSPNSEPKEDCWHHQYYQWVALVLVLQAGFFYFPRYLWQIWENGRISGLVSGLDKRTLIRGLQTKDALSSGELNEKLKGLVSHWREVRGSNNVWAVRFYFCEFLTVANVIFQFYATNFFLNGQFGRIAYDGLHLEEHQSVLPILTECAIQMYGAGGGTEKIYGLCVLPLNIVNQKFYTIFWYWLSALLVISFFAFALRLIVIFSTEARDFIIRYFYGIKDFNKHLILNSNHGDWFLLTSIMDNMNGMVNTYFMIELGKLKEYNVYTNFEE